MRNFDTARFIRIRNGVGAHRHRRQKTVATLMAGRVETPFLLSSRRLVA